MSGLNIVFWNACGLFSKFNDLKEMLREEEIDIACICETHFTNNTVLTPIPDYHCLRHDRLTHLGGLLTVFNKRISFEEIDLGQTQLMEYSSFLIKGTTPFVLVNCYLPGGARPPIIREHFNSDLDILSNSNLPFFVVGDMNARHTNWNCRRKNTAGAILSNKISNSSLKISFPAEHTYTPVSNRKTPSTIDLLITNGKMGWSRPYVKHLVNSDHLPVFNSDHLPVFFVIHCNDQRGERHTPKWTRNIRTANWKLFREQLDRDLIHNSQLVETMGAQDITDRVIVDELIDKLTNTTRQSFNHHVPISRVNKHGVTHNELTKNLIKKRNYHRRRWTRSRMPEDKFEYNSINKVIKTLIADEARTTLDKKLSKCKLGDHTIHKFIRRSKQPQNFPHIDPIPGEISKIYKDGAKSEAMATYFHKMHINPLANNNIFFTMGVTNQVANFLADTSTPTPTPPLKSRELALLIKNLKNGKAPGNDEIPTIAIKNLSHMTIELLCKIMNICLTTGYYPTKWKLAKTIPIHKAGKSPNDRASYRPISLLPIFAKLFDKIINNRLTAFNTLHNIIPDFQFGFRQGHSTNHALKYFHNNITRSLTRKETMGVLSYDVEKAFDRVWQDALIYKMINMGYPKYLTILTNDFIKGRSFFVSIGSEKSEIKSIPWGVPQGSALSPTLYNIYTSDMPSDLSCEIVLYADDTLLFTSDRLLNTITKRLSESADSLLTYFTKWKIKINKDKTILTSFTNRKTKQVPCGTLNINNTDLHWTNQFKYLGVTFDKKLTLNPHINNTLIKADYKIDLLEPYFRKQSTVPVQTKIYLYKTYVRPVLSYAYPILTNLTAKNTGALQVIQNKCLRKALDISWDSFTTTKEVESDAKIESLNVFVIRLSQAFQRKCNTSNNTTVLSLYS